MLTGSHKQVRYDGGVFGTPPFRRRNLRQAVGWAASARSRGRCLTSALALGLAGSASAFQSTQFGSQNIISSAATDVAEISPADLDGDGDIDVAAALTSLDRVVWYQKDSSGTFTQRILDSNMPNVTSVHTADLDGDGFRVCDGSEGTDCRDDDPDIYPGAEEVCDGADSDCDGVVPDEEADALINKVCMHADPEAKRALLAALFHFWAP